MNSTEALLNMTMQLVNITQLVLNSTEHMECDSACRLANRRRILAARQEWKAAEIIRKYVSLGVQCVGILGNILALIILCRPKMRRSSSAIYLIVLAFADAITLILLLISNLNRYYVNLKLDSDIWCKLHSFIAGSASSSSVWLTIAVTAERFVAVCFPLKASTLCTRKTAGITTTCITMSVLLYCIQEFWFIELHPRGKVCMLAYEYIKTIQVLSWVGSALAVFIPLALLLVLNTAIVNGVRKAVASQKRMTSDGGNLGGDGQSKQITVTVLTVSCTFILCNLPMATSNLVEYFLMDINDPIGVSKFALAGYTSQMLVALNHGVNFLLYIFSGKRFRDEFLEVFCCKSGKGKNKARSKSPASNAMSGTRASTTL